MIGQAPNDVTSTRWRRCSRAVGGREDTAAIFTKKKKSASDRSGAVCLAVLFNVFRSGDVSAILAAEGWDPRSANQRKRTP